MKSDTHDTQHGITQKESQRVVRSFSLSTRFFFYMVGGGGKTAR